MKIKACAGEFKRSSKKLKGNMVVTIIIFMLSFLVFCICAIDAGHVVVSRYKAQKVTETLVLYMTSYLNSKPVEERNQDALEPLKERFESLYSASMDGFYSFRVTNIELKNETTEPKLKISTEANIPTLFLKYAGIGILKIMQVSYAKVENVDMSMIDSDTNSYTFEANEIVTDKRGDDIKVKYDGDYFIFAGIKSTGGEIFWTDLSYATKDVKKSYTITSEEGAHTLGCIEKDAAYDFSRTDEKTIGFIKYVKIYKANCSEDLTLADESAAESADSETVAVAAPEVTILNSVKLIRRSQF